MLFQLVHNLFSNFYFLFYRLRQEFGIIKKIEKQTLSKDVNQNDKNVLISQIHGSITNNENLCIPKAENVQNKSDCSFMSCDCPRCKNMNGNLL